MFQDKLKNLRKENDITQNELAKEIFVSRSLIAKFETGTVFPSREILEKIALYFDVPISELIEQDEATLVAVEAQDISKKINLVALITILIIAASYSIIGFLPIIRCCRYVYPIPPGQDYPNFEYYFVSIFSGSYNYRNPIGLISFFISICVVIFSILSLVLKKKYTPILRLVTYLLFFIDVFVALAAVFCCFSYIS